MIIILKTTKLLCKTITDNVFYIIDDVLMFANLINDANNWIDRQ